MKFSLDRIAIMSSAGDVNYQEMLQHVSVFGNHTKELNPSKTIIFSENRIGWVYAFYSVWQNRSIAVPVDATATEPNGTLRYFSTASAVFLQASKPSCPVQALAMPEFTTTA